MNKLILDYSRWRCGGGDFSENEKIFPNKVGEGATLLLNEQGFMCCLGQFLPQIDTSIGAEDLRGMGTPCDLCREVSDLAHYAEVDDWEGGMTTIVKDTRLSDEAVEINDDPNTTPERKIELLKKLFGEHEYEIEVINKPQ